MARRYDGTTDELIVQPVSHRCIADMILRMSSLRRATPVLWRSYHLMASRDLSLSQHLPKMRLASLFLAVAGLVRAQIRYKCVGYSDCYVGCFSPPGAPLPYAVQAEQVATLVKLSFYNKYLPQGRKLSCSVTPSEGFPGENCVAEESAAEPSGNIFLVEHSGPLNLTPASFSPDIMAFTTCCKVVRRTSHRLDVHPPTSVKPWSFVEREPLVRVVCQAPTGPGEVSSICHRYFPRPFQASCMIAPNGCQKMYAAVRDGFCGWPKSQAESTAPLSANG
ncbi:uncharacterized protein L969DRAFT_49676 [Mixia osmundae IAM 14324]|uniref:Uncharacterized protein n=1 Tax=Mixia osmundae (strain CBS 9802 / IAM 14324 / JCM 22182 / KY 12970) TaxID=764103 RepID=G7E6S0_MIXOS|nr:uncharacterized protein L969DRAFT_49676 [Mixia osmundae IAM 14324]KEI39089.1 hypothetical protein L969DRAFT_49676 [Mixia osmundae IAM 14324]GAA98530.1 hypothetical protein E5Q_05217 [Mixia osmundae IAM 14324]